ncbi:MAG TPA: hypothetical protein VG675_20260 [Bryobacteraceae bacterium]|nr:hypothetical protein [Bryobacteraceae bacterium]
MAEGHSPGMSPVQGANLSEDLVRETLNRVLSSHEFRNSKRSQEFLRYVVEHVLAGHADYLKERTIGIEVFGRSTDYDPGEDATVRVKASEVRKRLGLYYAEQGAHDLLRIDLPLGSYVPEFHLAESPPVAEAARAIAEPAAFAQPPRHRSALRGLAACVVLLGVIAAGYLWLNNRPGSSPFDQFWAPVLAGKTSVQLCAAYVPVYGLNSDSEQPRPQDFVLLADQFVGGGDLIAISRLTAMLTRGRRPYRLRVGTDVTFQDLRAGPAILVGYSYTRWREISKELRYFIDGTRRPIGITDNGAPTQWSLPNLPADRRTDEDYAIVSRVSQSDTHAMLVEVAGITQYGTDAAADLITNSELMAEALHGAPVGWQRKNMQMILHVKVIAGSPSSPKVLATYFW